MSNNSTATILGAGTAGALAWLLCLLPAVEGVNYQGYLDPVGIPTKCVGDTHNVVVGHVYTVAECHASLMAAIERIGRPMLKATPELADAPSSTLAALISWNYKSGAYTATPSMLSVVRRRDWPGVCRAILFAPDGHRWYVTGKDRRTGKRIALAGLVRRADIEYALCIRDLNLPARQTVPVTREAEAALARLQALQPAELEKLTAGEIP